ncbi:MAG: metallophosphoesterase [Lentimicrobium sp.]|nr:metallophosphoesterase [Lentimicrobium sp.]
MNNKHKSLYNRLYIILGASLLIVSLYLLLLTALPKYAARVPFLGLLLVLDYFVFRYINPLWINFRRIWRLIFGFLWWLPVAVLFFFLFGSAAIPLNLMDKTLRIYLPGFALIFYLSKTVLFFFLMPSFVISMFHSGFAGLTRRKDLSAGIKFFKQMGILFGSLAFAGLLVGSTVWVYKFKTHRFELNINNLPSGLEGLRIVQLSDIHLGSWLSDKPLQKAVDQVNALNPDIIVFTGDLVNYSTMEVRGFEKALAKLTAPLGIYAILGNHDYGDYVSWNSPEEKEKNLQQLISFYDSLGWKLLRNSSTLVEKEGGSILIAGVENWSATARFRKYGDMEKTISGVTYGDVNLLLSHDPTHWETEVSKNYPVFDLTLSGHTHGMQMGIEAFGLKWSPARYLYENWAGLTSVNLPDNRKSYLYVNRGLGHIAYPGRIGILPEISLITLKKAN